MILVRVIDSDFGPGAFREPIDATLKDAIDRERSILEERRADENLTLEFIEIEVKTRAFLEHRVERVVTLTETVE